MNRFATAACLLIVAASQGCARQRDGAGAGTRRGADPFADARPAAAALVFEPGIAREGAPPELARDGREPEAFVGYAEGVTEYFYVRWDDRQGNRVFGRHGGGYDRFERRAVSEKVGALYR